MRKNYIRYGLVGILGLLVLVMLLAAWWTYTLDRRLGNDYVDLRLETPSPAEPYNILLLGFDKRPSWENYRSDAMLLLRINPATNEVWLVSLPRDYLVPVPNVGEVKLGQAFLFTGMQGSIDTVQYLLEMPIHYVVTVDFKSFVATVDALGGIEVDVPQAISDTAADETKGNKASTVLAGKQLLDGAHALTFVRSRDYADADFSRMNSQRIFLKALLNRFKSASIVTQLSAVRKAAPYLRTNMRMADVVRVVQDIRSIGVDKLQTRELPGTWEYPAVIPDVDDLAKVLDEIR